MKTTVTNKKELKQVEVTVKTVNLELSIEEANVLRTILYFLDNYGVARGTETRAFVRSIYESLVLSGEVDGTTEPDFGKIRACLPFAKPKS